MKKSVLCCHRQSVPIELLIFMQKMEKLYIIVSNLFPVCFVCCLLTSHNGKTINLFFILKSFQCYGWSFVCYTPWNNSNQKQKKNWKLPELFSNSIFAVFKWYLHAQMTFGLLRSQLKTHNSSRYVAILLSKYLLCLFRYSMRRKKSNFAWNFYLPSISVHTKNILYD